MKVFWAINIIAIYLYTARNAKLTSTGNVYEKTVMKWKKKGFQRCI